MSTEQRELPTHLGGYQCVENGVHDGGRYLGERWKAILGFVSAIGYAY
jgi:hypothetical protein